MRLCCAGLNAIATHAQRLTRSTRSSLSPLGPFPPQVGDIYQNFDAQGGIENIIRLSFPLLLAPAPRNERSPGG